MRLNQAVSERLAELMWQKGMNKYELHLKSGVPRTTITNVLRCSYESVKLRILSELCKGLGITVREFFDAPVFDNV